jgi:hypothetical protein
VNRRKAFPCLPVPPCGSRNTKRTRGCVLRYSLLVAPRPEHFGNLRWRMGFHFFCRTLKATDSPTMSEGRQYQRLSNYAEPSTMQRVGDSVRRLVLPFMLLPP